MGKKKHKIYLGLTTTRTSVWQDKIKEIKKLKLEEVAVFPTTLEEDERWQLYKALLGTSVKYVPFLHLRQDTEQEEIEFFAKNFKTKLFNVHPGRETMDHYETFPNRKTQIFVENTDVNKEFSKSVSFFAGICLDVSHWEDYGTIQKDPGYKDFAKTLTDNKIGFAHLATVRKKPCRRDYGKFGHHLWHYSAHLMEKPSDFEYLKKYRGYLPEIMGIELENPLSEQMKAKKYIEEKVLI